GCGGGPAMSALPFLLTLTQMRRLSPHFPRSHGVPRVDDRRVISGIIYVIRHRLEWSDAPVAYGQHETRYNTLRALEPWRVRPHLRGAGFRGWTA
ncbi:transposase, partial [Falsiroseomonas sp.]|uniref:transposase n=1 Tax=Falsiroseomonas sp. TaxID=2870721 RepID=UPI0035257629